MKLKYTIAALAVTTLAANAATILTADPAVNATGNYGGQSFTVTDLGFTTTGDPLTGTYNLQTVGFRAWSSTSGSASTYLNIYEGGTFLGSSTNVESWTSGHGNFVNYDFVGVTALEGLTDSTLYSALFSSTNTAGSIITVRPGLSGGVAASGGFLANGTPLTTSGTIVSADYDLVMRVQITPVPEPSSTALLGLGGLALILRRRK